MEFQGQYGTLDELIKEAILSEPFLALPVIEQKLIKWIDWLEKLEQQHLELGSDAEDGDKQEEPIQGPDTKGKAKKQVPLNAFMARLENFPGQEGAMATQEREDTDVMFLNQDLEGHDMQIIEEIGGQQYRMLAYKCDRCPQHFFSWVNRRRHIWTSHLHPEKEDLEKMKEQVAAYWDKLNLEEACKIMSIDYISLPVVFVCILVCTAASNNHEVIIRSRTLALVFQDISAAFIVGILPTQLKVPNLFGLPQAHIVSATLLLTVVENMPTLFPLPSQELFFALRMLSEENLLCGVLSPLMQQFMFDHDTRRVGLERKNLLASFGFLVELGLVRAWKDDLEAEAVRCSKALLDEEEATYQKPGKPQKKKKKPKRHNESTVGREKTGSELLDSQAVKIGPALGDIDTPHKEEDDSRTVAAHSSLLSSTSSAQDNDHLEKTAMDSNELADIVDKSKSWQWADEQLNDDSNDAGAWIPTVSKRKTAGFALQTGFLDEIGKSEGCSNTRFGKHGEDKIEGGQGWRERGESDVIESSSYKQQPYSYHRRYPELHRGQGERRDAGKVRNVDQQLPGNVPGVDLHSELYSSTSKRNAVWTRKGPQSPASMETEHSKPKELLVGSIQVPLTSLISSSQEEQGHPHVPASDGDAGISSQNTQGGDDVEAEGAGKGSSTSNIRGGADEEAEPGGGDCSTPHIQGGHDKEGQPAGCGSNSASSVPYIASFLSQRWRDAIASPDCVDLKTYQRKLDDLERLSLEMSDDGVPTHQCQNK